MTADRIMQTAFWVLRLVTVNMTVSSGLFSAMSALLRGLALRHRRALQGYSESGIAANRIGIPVNDAGRAVVTGCRTSAPGSEPPPQADTVELNAQVMSVLARSRSRLFARLASDSRPDNSRSVATGFRKVHVKIGHVALGEHAIDAGPELAAIHHIRSEQHCLRVVRAQ